MQQAQQRVTGQHARAGPAHDLDDPSAHRGTVAVNGAMAARHLQLPENADVETLPGIPQQSRAAIAERAAVVMVAAVDVEHGFDRAFFAADASAAVDRSQPLDALFRLLAIGESLHGAIILTGALPELMFVK
jgi:hypothetical protein